MIFLSDPLGIIWLFRMLHPRIMILSLEYQVVPSDNQEFCHGEKPIHSIFFVVDSSVYFLNILFDLQKFPAEQPVEKGPGPGERFCDILI